MELVKKIETKLEEAFKGLPEFPKSSKETLAQIWPWMALIAGILQIAAAWALWRLTRVVDAINQIATYYSQYYSTQNVGLSTYDKTVIYLGIIMLIVDAVILLMAFSPLRERSRKGWDLLFLGALINVAYSVVSIFINGRGVSSFIMSLIGSAIGFYLLFQVKEKFNGKKPVAKPSAPAPKAD
jgi:predicted neutral ceramidase superfamily lipid hydrolase